MSKETDLETMATTGRPHYDLGLPNADVSIMKARLAADIIEILNRRGLKGAAACEATGLDSADLSRVRNADLKRFTVDKLTAVANSLGRHVELSITNADRAA